MLEVLFIAFTIVFIYKFLTMKITWLRVFIVVSIAAIYMYISNYGNVF